MPSGLFCKIWKSDIILLGSSRSFSFFFNLSRSRSQVRSALGSSLTDRSRVRESDWGDRERSRSSRGFRERSWDRERSWRRRRSLRSKKERSLNYTFNHNNIFHDNLKLRVIIIQLFWCKLGCHIVTKKFWSFLSQEQDKKKIKVPRTVQSCQVKSQNKMMVPGSTSSITRARASTARHCS